MELSQRIQRVADHQAILEQMARYIQAVDRLDLELLKSTFHSDGVVKFGIFDGNAHEFCDFDIPFIRDNLTMGAHRFSTATIEFHSDTRAVAESYMLGNAAAPTPDGVMLNFPDNMRYEDIWEKRDGVWRMSSRDLVMDWNAFWPYSQREDGPFAMDWNAFWPYSQREDGPFADMRRGRRDTQDPAYALRAGSL